MDLFLLVVREFRLVCSHEQGKKIFAVLLRHQHGILRNRFRCTVQIIKCPVLRDIHQLGIHEESVEPEGKRREKEFPVGLHRTEQIIEVFLSGESVSAVDILVYIHKDIFTGKIIHSRKVQKNIRRVATQDIEDQFPLLVLE